MPLRPETAARLHAALRLCDKPERLGARIFLRLGVRECACCAFWRGVLLGVLSMTLIYGVALWLMVN